MTESSILLPVVAALCVLLDHAEGYSVLVKQVVPLFRATTLQIWHPQAAYEDAMDGRSELPWVYGISEAPYLLPESFDEFKAQLALRPTGASLEDDFEFNKNGLPWLPLIASRTFRGPVPLWFVLQALKETGTTEAKTRAAASSAHNPEN